MYESFRDMPVWREAMEIAAEVFRLTDGLPKKEDYGVTSQIRRSALSISGNIAEGFGRHHSKDKMNFYYIARGSATETQSHLEYCRRVGYIPETSVATLDVRLSQLIHDINKIIQSLNFSAST
ncbi:MAG: four helix bundle protein [Bacteroidetes bacterium]|nr:four helix bundle protein [Bacteroidota bacterium]MCW5897430.1 four helix bundle protein [Bacteroidota bacterium]